MYKDRPYGLTKDQIMFLVNHPDLADFFEACVEVLFTKAGVNFGDYKKLINQIHHKDKGYG
jgi:hypothetical protein